MINLSYCVYLLLIARVERERELSRIRRARWVAKDPEREKERCRKKSLAYQKAHPEKKKQYARAWYEKTKTLPERLEKKRAAARKASKKWRANNLEVAKEGCRKSARKWAKENPDRYRESCRLWAQKNPTKVKERNKRWRKKPGVAQFNCKLTDNLRRRVNKVLNGASKSARTLALVGCSVSELRQHLEKQFKPGMNWENYGFRGWHIDHIKPCAKFDLTNPAQQRECFHYTNLQPLWAVENIKKGDSYGRG